VLGIILEFYNVVVSIFSAHQVRLGATSHPPDVLNRINGHMEGIVATARTAVSIQQLAILANC